ncbi:MAG: DUF2232 domain-containing protein [Clostridia bacterium]|nr:DUF2232 domain-containing protein [Clostridia bacterium]
MVENRFKNHILLLVASVILTLLTLLPLGIFGVIVTTLLTTLVGYTVTKHHYSFVAVVCASILLIYVLFSGNLIASVFAALPIILCGLTLGIAYNLKFSSFKTIGIFTGVYTLNILSVLMLYGKNILSDISESLNEFISSESAQQFLSTSSDVNAESLKEFAGQIMTIFTLLMPAIIVIACILFAILNFVIFKKLLKFLKADISFYSEFPLWRADVSMSVIYFIIVALAMLAPRTNYIYAALLNVVAISTFVFFIFGLSFADYILTIKLKKQLLRKVILVILTVSSLLVLGFPFFILVFAGALDGCFNFRKKYATNQSNE